ncbi:MAG TPA: exosortase/archaeosortase family protein [Opitutaceae bacterium]|nr:exosortase/archaeosortase family protein [Opitutaceae bacterium]
MSGMGHNNANFRRGAGVALGAALLVSGGALYLVFQYFGNAALGYIHSKSLFHWWGAQWLDPAAETQHGILVVLAALWLFWRNLRQASAGAEESGMRSDESTHARPQGHAEPQGHVQPRWVGRTEPKATLDTVTGEPQSRGLTSEVSHAQSGSPGTARPTSEAGSHSGRKLIPGLAIVALGLALHVLAFGMQQTRLSIVALLLCVDGLLRLFCGPHWERAARFPLFFVLLAIPFSFLQPLGFYLRLGVSQTAEWVVHAMHLPIIRSGTQLFSPEGKYQYDVAAACSGIRSLVAFVALSWIIGYVRLRGFWRRVALVALVVPSALLGNLLRILAIVFAAQIGRQSAGERIHAWSGWAVYLIVFGLLLACARWLKPKENSATEKFPRERGARVPSEIAVFAKRGSDIAAPPRLENAATSDGVYAGGLDSRSRAFSLRRLAVATLGICALATCGALACRALDQRLPDPRAGVRLAANGVDPIELPAFLGTKWIGQGAEVTPIERSVLPPDTGYSRKNYVATRDGSQVFVSVVLSGRDRTSIHRPELCLVGQGWRTVSETRGTLPSQPAGASNGATPAALPVTLLHIEKDLPRADGGSARVRSLLAYCFVGPDRVVASHAEMVWQSSLARLRRLRGDRWAYIVVQTRAEDGESAAKARMEEVFPAVWRELKAGAEEGDFSASP